MTLATPLAANPPASPTTASERSGFERTGRYDEVIALCDQFARGWPTAVRCEDFGTTPEGRPMKVLVVSRSGALTPDAVRARGIPVVLMQGGIHAGEIDGKDAGFLALREVLRGEAAKGALDDLVWLFVPVFNVDGHERFGAWNRPNQRGPVEMGWRSTAQNYNLNRDYLKADTPEMRAMLALVERWDPLLVVDLHATDGAQFEHDISITGEPVNAGDPALRAIGRALRDGVVADLAEAGHLPVPFYPSFVEYEDPASGIDDGVAPPRFSTGYFWLRNRLALLVETHSWRPYPQRVRSTRNTIVSILERVARDGAAWRREADAADARAGALAGGELPVVWAPVGDGRLIDFRGYAYTRTPSEVSGALMTRYDETTPQVWRIPLRDTLAPSVTVDVPGAGYLVPAAHAAWVAMVLDLHGVDYRRLDTALPAQPLEVFRAESVGYSPATVEGHTRMTPTGAWAVEPQALPAGSLFVPVAQAKARVVVSLFEPMAPDSLLAWGMFATAFEAKEYLEDYVAEAVAREMLAADPALRGEFAAKLRDDPAFAADPAKRLEFFARRHASWDERYMLYPVFRTDVAP
nr:M14 family metallopeptidase [Arenimonas composti]